MFFLKKIIFFVSITFIISKEFEIEDTVESMDNVEIIDVTIDNVDDGKEDKIVKVEDCFEVIDDDDDVVVGNNVFGNDKIFCLVVTLVIDDDNDVLVEGFDNIVEDIRVVGGVVGVVVVVVDNIVDVDIVVVIGGAPHLLILSQSHVDGHNSKQFTSIDVFEYNWLDVKCSKNQKLYI